MSLNIEFVGDFERQSVNCVGCPFLIPCYEAESLKHGFEFQYANHSTLTHLKFFLYYFHIIFLHKLAGCLTKTFTTFQISVICAISKWKLRRKHKVLFVLTENCVFTVFVPFTCLIFQNKAVPDERAESLKPQGKSKMTA